MTRCYFYGKPRRFLPRWKIKGVMDEVSPPLSWPSSHATGEQMPPWSRDGEGTLRATYEELMRCAGCDQVCCGRRGAHPTGRPASASPGRAVSGGRGTELESHQDNLRAERPLAFHTRFLLIPLIRVAVVFFLNEKPSLRPAWGAWRSFRELGAGLRGADVAPGLTEPLEGEGGGGRGGRASRFRLPHLSNRPLCLPGRPPPGLFSAHSLTMPCP